MRLLGCNCEAQALIHTASRIGFENAQSKLCIGDIRFGHQLCEQICTKALTLTGRTELNLDKFPLPAVSNHFQQSNRLRAAQQDLGALEVCEDSSSVLLFRLNNA